MSKENINLKSLFIGPKAENGDLYKAVLSDLIDEHMGWRKNYIPTDPSFITPADQEQPSFKNTVTKTKCVLEEVSRRLRASAVPWHSAGRYWAQMNSETLMPAQLAYNFAMLWNGNNVAYEASPATSQMEEEVGMDFSHLCGYGNEGWGHLTAGGTPANMEGLWYARNFKSMPRAFAKVIPEVVKGKSEWELLNMPTAEIVKIMLSHMDKLDEIKEASARGVGGIDKLGVLIVPQTKHYSWPKLADVLGIGHHHVVSIPVDEHYRMKIDVLEQTIRDLTAKHIPIMCVVGVVGTTEEGQVDHIDQIIALRKKLYEEQGTYFYVHVDAAYGSYARALFLDENSNFIPYEELNSKFNEYDVFEDKNFKIDRDVYDAYKAIGEAESTTVDPHKMGYIPYSAGGIAIKDKNMRAVIGYFAAYVIDKASKAPSLLGSYILEGSKAGATAAAVWTAHRVLPLNVSGYGRLIGASIESARNFYNFMKDRTFKVNGKTITAKMLTVPDFNMVDYVFHMEGATLEENNELNRKFWEVTSSGLVDLYQQDFLVSHTDFAKPDYGDSPVPFVTKELGYSMEDWNRVGKITILRCSGMTPYMRDPETCEYFCTSIKNSIERTLAKIVK